MRWTLLILLLMACDAFSAPKWRFSNPDAVNLCERATAPLQRSPKYLNKKAWDAIDSYRKLWTNFCSVGSVVTMPKIVEAVQRLDKALAGTRATSSEGEDDFLRKLSDQVPLIHIEWEDGIYIWSTLYPALEAVALTDEDRTFLQAARTLKLGEVGDPEPWRWFTCWKFGSVDWTKIIGAFSDAHKFQSKIYIGTVSELELSLLRNLLAVKESRELVACNCASRTAFPKDLASLQSLVAGKGDLVALESIVKDLRPEQLKISTEHDHCEPEKVATTSPTPTTSAIKTTLLTKAEVEPIVQRVPREKECGSYEIIEKQNFLVKAPQNVFDGYKLVSVYCGEVGPPYFLEFDRQDHLVAVVKDHSANEGLVGISLEAIGLRDVNGDGFPDLLASAMGHTGHGADGATDISLLTIWAGNAEGKWTRDFKLEDKAGGNVSIREAVKKLTKPQK